MSLFYYPDTGEVVEVPSDVDFTILQWAVDILRQYDMDVDLIGQIQKLKHIEQQCLDDDALIPIRPSGRVQD